MDEIKKFLDERKKNHLLRTLTPITKKNNPKIYFNNQELIDFSSNDYLGLSQHPEMINAMVNTTKEFGTSTSSSRLISGTYSLFNELETALAKFKNKPAGLVFNSGYQANLSIISAIAENDYVIFSDKLNHRSIIDGILLSKAKVFRYRHNDIEHLESLLKTKRNQAKNALIITESVFSMDGDFTPLPDLVKLKNKYNAEILLDEAHATGIFGKNGSGLAEELGLTDQIDYLMGTFSKALGSFGAYLACSENTKNYLIQKAAGFIYSTSLPPGVIAANLKSLELIKIEPWRREKLKTNFNFLQKKLITSKLKNNSNSQIIPIIYESPEKTLAMQKKLMQAGIFVPAVRPPTVPNNASRLRVSVSAKHDEVELKKLVKKLL